MRSRLLVVALLSVLTALGSASVASATVTCVIDGTKATVTQPTSNGQVTLSRGSNGAFSVQDTAGSVPCGTTSTLSSLDVTAASGNVVFLVFTQGMPTPTHVTVHPAGPSVFVQMPSSGSSVRAGSSNGTDIRLALDADQDFDDVAIDGTATINVIGSAAADTFAAVGGTGTPAPPYGRLSVNSLGGNDTLSGPARFTAGPGDDTLTAGAAKIGIGVNGPGPLRMRSDLGGTEAGYDGDGGTDTYVGFGSVPVSVIGTPADDVLYGTEDEDVLDGQAGDDTLTARGSFDLIYGGPGADKIYARDNSNDNVYCGTEVDTGTVDYADGRTQCDDIAPATVSINDVTVAENAGPAVFTLTLSEPLEFDQAVRVTPTAGSAQAGSDFGSGATLVIFPAGTTTQTVSVPIVNNGVYEPTETFTMVLSRSPNSNSVALGSPGTGTITDDEAQPTISIGDLSKSEGDSGGTLFSFTATLSGPSSQTVTAAYGTASGTATVNSDLYSEYGTVTLYPGDTERSFSVYARGDITFENDETFFVNLSNATNATFADSQGLGTILNDDPQPTISVANTQAREGNLAEVPVSLSNPSAFPISVDYAAAVAGTASADDFTAKTGTVTFTPGQTSKTVPIQTTDDALSELDETFEVRLSNVQGRASIAAATAVVTIQDEDPQPTLAITDAPVTEGSVANLTVTLSAVSGRPVTVNYTTAPGTAVTTTPFPDYSTTSGTLTFAAGETTKTIPVTTVNDTLHEPTEVFAVNLSGASGASIADGQGVVTITDDDPIPSIAVEDETVTEGGSTDVTVSLSNPSADTVTVDYATAEGTATGADHTPANAKLTFTPGQTSKTVTLQTTQDTIDEPDEQFAINLTTPVNASIADGQGVVTIADDDGTPAATVTDTTVTEGATAAVEVKLSNPSSTSIDVAYETAAGTAGAADFTTTNGTLTFAPGDTEKTVQIETKQDTVDEPDETFKLKAGGSSGTVSITDDDPVPTVSLKDTTVAEGKQASVPLTLSNPSSTEITVNADTIDGTAKANDFAGGPRAVKIPAGETQATVTVDTTQDAIAEDTETFTVTAGGASATVSITDDDAGALTLSGPAEPVAEGSDATVTVKLGEGAEKAVKVDVGSSTVTLAPGETSKDVKVPIPDDAVYERGETVKVELSKPVGAGLGSPASAVIRVADNDPVPTPTLTGPQSIAAGQAYPATASGLVAGARLECTVGVAFGACPANLVFIGLEPGSYTLRVRQVDPDGRTSASASVTFTVQAAATPLTCTKIALEIVGIEPRSRGRFRVTGITDARRFGSHTVTVLAGARELGRATVAADGTFVVTGRPGAAKRVVARLDTGQESRDLSLARSVVIHSHKAVAGGERISFSLRSERKATVAVIRRQTGCSTYARTDAVRLKDNRGTVTLPAPADNGDPFAVYRIVIRTRNGAGAGYTLPIAVRAAAAR